MTDFSKLSKPQQRVLGLIAINIDGGHNPRTLTSLMNMGLIECCEHELAGRFPTRIFHYHVPIHVHIAWCEWCCTQPDEEE